MKNKWDIIGRDIDKDNYEEYNNYFYYWYDGDFYDSNYDYQNYDYLEEVYDNYISKKGIKVSIYTSLRGRYIDIMSVYSKQVLRQIKIDQLLGLENFYFSKKTTIGDIIKYKDNNEKNRDI
jgi:hypothetical protein